MSTTDSAIITGLNDDQPYMSMTSATINTARLKFIYNIILKYMSRTHEQLLQLNANIQMLVRNHRRARKEYTETLARPATNTEAMARRPAVTANYNRTLKALLNKGLKRSQIIRLLNQPNVPVVVNQPNGSKSLGY
jgi:hypothetical protein